MSDNRIPELETLQSQLDAETAERVKRLADTNDWLLQLRQKLLRSEIERTQADPRFSALADKTDRLVKVIGGWPDRATRPLGSMASRWSTDVEPLLQQFITGPESRLQREFHRDGGFALGGWEQEFIERLKIGDRTGGRFTAAFDEFGIYKFEDEPPEPVPVSPANDPVGVIRQALEPPLDACVTTPFAFAIGAKADPGIAIIDSSFGGSVDGSGFAFARAIAIVAMGGGSSASSLIGGQINYPTGYDTLSCTAVLDVSYSGMSIAALTAGSTFSIDVVLKAQLPDGSVSATRRTLAAIPSAVLISRTHGDTKPDLMLTLPNIAINGAAGPVRIFAGVEVFAAAGAIVGSAAAVVSANFTMKRLCIAAR